MSPKKPTHDGPSASVSPSPGPSICRGLPTGLIALVLANAFAISAPHVTAQAPEWPGLRGPNHDGVAPESRPPLEWGTGKNIAWKLELPGPGSSSPVIVGDKLFVACYTGYGHYLDDGGEPDKLEHHLVCVQRHTGKELWTTTVPGRREKKAPRVQISEHGFASPTPVTDGRRIFAYFGTAGVVAFDLQGEILWHESTGIVDANTGTPTNQVVRQGKALTLRWGAAASPVLHAGLLIVNASEESNSVRAYDQDTGKLIWTFTSADLEGCATSPMIAGPAGAEVVVMCLGGQVWGLDPKTGKRRWQVETGTRGGMSPTPVTDGKLVYTFGGMGKSFALRLGDLDEATIAAHAKRAAEEKEQAEVEQAEARKAAEAQGIEAAPPPESSPRVAWKSGNLDIPSPALFDGKLFLVSSDGMGQCLQAQDGKSVFKGRLEGRTSSVYASPIVANGNIYVVSRKRGTFVYSADGQFKLRCRNQIDDDAQFNASPAIVGDKLYLRSDKFVYCVAQQ